MRKVKTSELLVILEITEEWTFRQKAIWLFAIIFGLIKIKKETKS